MASIRKRGDKWVAEVRRKGAYKARLFETKMEAVAWATQCEHDYGRSGKVLKGRTLADALTRYTQEISPSKKGARWEVVRAEKLKRDALADVQLTSLTHDDLQDWVRRQETKGSTINRDLNFISAVLRMARLRWKWMNHEVMRDVQRPKGSPPRDRLITDAERDRILLALEYEERLPVTTTRQKIAVVFLLALETAMRRGEIWSLTWDDVHLEKSYLHLRDTKNGTPRNVPLSMRALELFKKLQGTSHKVIDVPHSSAESIFRRAVKLAGFEDLHFHDTRHTAITRLARKLDVLDLARMVGHRDIRSLYAYYNATAEDIAKRLG